MIFFRFYLEISYTTFFFLLEIMTLCKIQYVYCSKMTQNRLCTIYNVPQRKKVNHVKIAAAAAAATFDGDGCFELFFFSFFLSIFHMDFFFFISVLRYTYHLILA